MKIKIERISMVIWVISIISIIIGSLLPDIATPEKYHIDKFIHGGAYAGLAFLAFYFIKNQKIFTLIITCIILMGGAIEIIQTFIPERSGTIGDFAADFIGTICGVLIAKKMKPILIRWFQ